MNHVKSSRDHLVATLMKDHIRDDLYMKHAWAAWSHFIYCYHTDESMRRLAKALPDALKAKLAA